MTTTRTLRRCFELGRELRANAEALNELTDKTRRELDEQRQKWQAQLERDAERRDATNRKGRDE